MDETAICVICEETKPVADFGPCSRRRSGRDTRCRLCYRDYMRKWREDNLERAEANEWNSHLLRKYGITAAQYAAEAARQNHCCALCLEPTLTFPGGKKKREVRGLVVDHDHTTGRVRGLLCRTCNATLARIESFPGWEQRALEYLASGHDIRELACTPA